MFNTYNIITIIFIINNYLDLDLIYSVPIQSVFANFIVRYLTLNININD